MKVITMSRFHQPGRKAADVSDFYYRDYPIETNHVRNLNASMIESGEILARFVALDETGDLLVTYTIFATEEAFERFNTHPTVQAARRYWADRDWVEENQVIRCKDLVNVGEWGTQQ